MRRASRIQILWGWLLFVVLGSCAVLGALVYRPDNPYATPSDMRPVVNNFNPLFCAGAKIISPKLTFDAYLIQGGLKTDVVDRNIYESKSAFYVDAKQYYLYTFYLLRDSSVKMRHCPKQPLMFYVFRGVDNFDKWKEDHFCDGCFLYKRFLFYSDEFTMLTQDEGEYFLVYSNELRTGTWVDLHVSQNRSVYDLGDSAPVCSNVYECEVSIYDLEQTAIYQVNGYYNLDDNSHPVFTTKCVPRIWSYVIIHGVIAVLIGALGTVLIHKCCKDGPNRIAMNGQQDERAPLINNQLPPSYSTVILSPPKYEDVVKDSDSDLPSYSEVLSVDAFRQIIAPGPVGNQNSYQRDLQLPGPVENQNSFQRDSQVPSSSHMPDEISGCICHANRETAVFVNVYENAAVCSLLVTNSDDVEQRNSQTRGDSDNDWNLNNSINETNSQGSESGNLVAQNINANRHTPIDSRCINNCEAENELVTR